MSTVQPITGRQQLQAAYDEYRAASDVLWASYRRNAMQVEVRPLRNAMHATADQFHVWRLAARDAFAKSRGWRFDKKSWQYHAGGYGAKGRPFINHPERFRDLATGECVGLVTHTSATVDEVAAYAHRMNYNAELLPFSWDTPDGRYHAILLTLKEGARWVI
jgi:hypothetical protein